jgi:penicillin-binding protein 1A
MAQAYATFANGGYSVIPYVIDSIRGPTEEVLYRASPAIVCQRCEPAVEEEAEPDDLIFSAPSEPQDIDYVEVQSQRRAKPVSDEQRAHAAQMVLEQMATSAEFFQPDAKVAPELFATMQLAPRIITPQVAYLIQDAMRDVIRRGTGIRAWRAFEGRRTDLSGKTGTSNDRRDAWFAGYNSKLVGIVWVGYDEFTPLGPREEGSRTALPIWIEFMKIALDGMPLSQMPMPEGMTSVRINKKTGCPPTPSDNFEDTMFEVFRDEYIPECDIATEEPNIFNAAQEFDDDPAEDVGDEEDDPIF